MFGNSEFKLWPLLAFILMAVIALFTYFIVAFGVHVWQAAAKPFLLHLASSAPQNRSHSLVIII